MKIIGENGSHVILTATKDEVRNLQGNFGSHRFKVEPGMSFEVHRMYQLVSKIYGIENQLNAAKKTIEAVASLLELPKDLVEVCEEIKQAQPKE